MASGSYRLFDEPRPGPMSHLAVQPIWILLSAMLGGAWLAWPWFLLNGFAVGSPTRRREALLVVAGAVGTFGILSLLFYLLDTGGPFETHNGTLIRLALLVPLLWKIGFAYLLTSIQGRTIELHRYYGGVIRSGGLVALGAFFLRKPVLGALPVFWQLVLS